MTISESTFTPVDRISMSTESMKTLQADLRTAYVCGAPGALVSGIVWLAAMVTSLFAGTTASVWVLLVGGMAIFPLSLVVCRIAGASGKHATENPLALLAMEGTAWLMAGIFIAFATILAGTKLFFPVMLLVIGSRYFTFQSLYGLRVYWVAAVALCVSGFFTTVLSSPTWVPTALGGIIEIILAVVLLLQRKSD